MDNLYQKLKRTLVIGSCVVALAFGIALKDFVYKHRSYSVERQYLLLLWKAEEISRDLGFIQAVRENCILEFTEMMAHGVKPNYKQIMERAEMNLHGQTPTIEQRCYVADYVRINGSLKHKESELKPKEAQLFDKLHKLEPKYFEALMTHGRIN